MNRFRRARWESSILRDAASILLAGILLLVPGAAVVDLFNPDEPREAEIAREMRVTGDLQVPHFDACPFLEKPPFFYWSVLASTWIPGLGPEMAVRLPSVLAALGLLLVVYFLGRELYDRRTGRAGALLLLTTFEFWWLGKRALLDMTLAFFVGAAMLCVLLADRRSRGLRWLLAAGIAATGAALTKGLIGLLIPGLAIVVYHLWQRKPRAIFAPGLLVAGVIPLVALGVWVALLGGRPDGACFVREFLVENHVKRFLGAGSGGHQQPIWYYLGSLATDYQPWSLFLPGALISLWPGLGASRRQRAVSRSEVPQQEVHPGPVHLDEPHVDEDRGPVHLDDVDEDRSEVHSRPEADTAREVAPASARDGASDPFLHAWLLPALLVLTVSSSKRSIYLLPLAAPMSLLVAAWWRRRVCPAGRTRAQGCLEPEGSRRKRPDLLVPGALLAVLSVILSVAVSVLLAALLSSRLPSSPREAFLRVMSMPWALLPGAALLAGIVSVAFRARRDLRKAGAAAMGLAGVLLFVGGTVLLPLAGPLVSARRFGEVLRKERERGTRLAASGIAEGSLGQFLFYSGGTMEWIRPHSRKPESACTDCRLLTSPEIWLAGPGPRACLLARSELERIGPSPGRRIVFEATIGGADYVLVSSGP